MNQIVYIVGVQFKKRLNLLNLITFNKFINFIDGKDNINNVIVGNNNVIEFRIGQGLSKQEIQIILFITKNIKRNNYLLNNNYKNEIQICNNITHKHRIKNTMISMPEKIDEKTFKSYLCIDEECAEMSDHMTGVHIQGMVLIEAARQMVNAVTEKYLIDNQQSRYFVLNGIDVDFKHYVFPVEVEIFYKIIGIRYGLKGNCSAIAQISFLQNNLVVFTANIKHQAMDSIIMRNYELNLAKKSIVGVPLVKDNNAN